MAVQNGPRTIRVSWTAPPGGGRYRVTADPGGISVSTSSSPLAIVILQLGVYNIRVMTLSQHIPGTVGPVQVTVRSKRVAS